MIHEGESQGTNVPCTAKKYNNFKVGELRYSVTPNPGTQILLVIENPDKHNLI